jgi:type II secretory ATPase GspE/PulE/Tfp pilus assembly ATPase PilB-like protein/putative methionine-R-sulfoxide reductase with GAF domain
MLNSFLYENLLLEIQATTHKHNRINEAFEHLEALILNAFTCKRVSIYQRRSHHKDLIARYKTGTESREMKVAINTQSIVGYVAMAQQATIINNVSDAQELAAIHHKLRFDPRFDRLGNFKTKNVLCVPIKHNGLFVGVLELLNTEDPGFSQEEAKLATDIANLIAQAYKHELGGTSRPFSYLIHTNKIEEEALKNFTSHSSINQGMKFLLSEYKLPLDDIGEALAVYYQVPYIKYAPDTYRVTSINALLNTTYLKKNYTAIVRDNKERLIVIMFDPNNIELLMEIENAIGSEEYQLAFGLPDDILKYLGEKQTLSSTSKFDEIISEIDVVPADYQQHEESNVEDEPAIVRLVSNFLAEAKRLNASDIHIDPEPDGPTLVRMRVDGVVRDINQIPNHFHKAVVSRIKIMSGLNISERRVPQDGKLVFKLSGQSIEVRVATIPTVIGEGVVMRVLAGGGAIPLEKINLSQRNADMLAPMITMPHGILLVVGPTGSGKTSTLHAVLGKLNTPDKKIWTAEDPVEITQYRLQQVQVNPKVGFTYAAALRAFLRADPDVILIGEMRDKETAHAAIEASLTGHLVMSTLHTNSAPETITRLLDLGMDPVNFSDACVGILAQRLIRTICSKCKYSYKPDDAEIAYLKRQYGHDCWDELGAADENITLYRGEGCDDCDDTGYKGRTGVHELLSMSPELRGLIYNGCSIHQIKEQAMKDGMRTLLQDAVLKIMKGDSDTAQIKKLNGAGTWRRY